MKTRAVERGKAKTIYLKKAEECREAMIKSFEAKNWNACVINAIHCAISSADAICIFKLGVRNASPRHEDAIALLLSVDPSSEDVKRSVKHLTHLLNIKTDVEYGERLFTSKESEEAIKHAERIFSFAKLVVKE